MPSNVKQNKRRGHQAEGEVAKRTHNWPRAWQMERTGLDGGHDLTGQFAVGEVKSVKAGPAWLQAGLDQMNNTPGKNQVLLVKLGAGSGKGSRWLAVTSLEQFEYLIEREQHAAEADD